MVHCKKFCSNSSKSMSGFCPGQTRLQRLQNEAFRDFLKIDIYMYLHGSVQAPTGNASSVSRFFDIAATRSCALWARSYFHPIPDQAKQTFRSAFLSALQTAICTGNWSSSFRSSCGFSRSAGACPPNIDRLGLMRCFWTSKPSWERQLLIQPLWTHELLGSQASL